MALGIFPDALASDLGERSRMVMPTLSVSLIGLVVAALLVMTDSEAPVQTFLGGFLGAWLGFVFGALAGVIVDVATGSGVFLAMAGHAAALVGAAVFASRGQRSMLFRVSAGWARVVGPVGEPQASPQVHRVGRYATSGPSS